MTPTETQKALSRRAIEMWAGGNSDQPDEIFASHYVNHQEPKLEAGASDISLEEWKALVTKHHEAFPDLKVRVLMQIAESGLVATRWEFSGTQTGSFLGHRPTGKQTTWTGVQIDRHEDGKIVESWVDWDKFRCLDGLGFVKVI